MGRETYLADLYCQSVQALTQNRAEWMGLLSSVSKYYKMSFDKNVLIYIQRPDAGLLATKAGWEKQTGRYLKAGSKGIGVVDMNNPKATLTYYFDLADTRGDYEGFQKAMNAVWSLERQYQPEILHRFHESLGTDDGNMENCLCQLAGMQADAFLKKYPPRVEVRNQDCVLYGLPAEAVQEEFAKLASDSAAYIIFKKCGIRTEVFEETGAFENISHFGSLELFMGLGYYACAIARPVLSEIHKRIEDIKEERSQRYETGTVSKTGIYKGGGRDAVSEPPDIYRQEMRPETSRDVWEKVEGLYEVGTPSEIVGADRTGTDQRDDRQGGQGGGSEERDADTAASGSTADAGDRGYAGESRTHGDDNQAGGRNHTERDRISAQIAGQGTGEKPGKSSAGNITGNNDTEEPKTDIAAEGSSFYLTDAATKEDIREHKDWDEIRRLLTDTSVYPQGLYERINQVFRQAASTEAIRDAVRNIYLDYGLQKNSDGTMGIMPGRDAADLFWGEDGFVRLSWDVAAHAIGILIRDGEYLSFHEEEDSVGDFNISDEDIPGEDISGENIPGVLEGAQESRENDHADGQLSLFDLYSGSGDGDVQTDEHMLRPEAALEEEKKRDLPFPLGSRIAYDGRIYEILGYGDDGHTVEMGDIEQQKEDGVYKAREILPAALIANAELLKSLYTEADYTEAEAGEVIQTEQGGGSNYRYQPEHHLYEGGPKAKFRNNVEAIRLLKHLQQEKRMASAEEQIILARFVGWGGLANALTPGRGGNDSQVNHWEKEYDEITGLLTEEEMQSAAASTLTSYYTDQKIIGYIYQALYNFGFRSGNILDPALGTGNFFSALPEGMSQSKLYGVELEPIAGGIARKLYPQADILIKGFEDTDFPDSFFDVVVGNVPFHSIKVSDKRYDRYHLKIHEYFLAKCLDKIRAGGIMAVITTKFTLDKENQTMRKYVAQRAELIGVATLLYRPIITMVACHRINRYNDMRTGKGKGFRTLIFCREPYPETIIKNMVIISKYEVEYKKGEDIFNQQ